MINKAEVQFNTIIEHLKSKKSEQIDKVIKAYKTAFKLHEGQTRKGGEPYIEHPVAVACILDKLNFDTDLLCSALLHDTVEDCGYLLEQLTKDFNSDIAEIVDAVSEIKKETYITDSGSIFDDENFLKMSMDNQTYQKLISMGKKNQMAFYIKFADRVHNLQTIGAFSSSKQIEKVKQTEQWVIPLSKMLKSTYFYYTLQNECFKIVNAKKLTQFLNNYKDYVKNNAEIFAEIEAIIKNYFVLNISSKQINIELPSVNIFALDEKQTYESIKKKVSIIGFDVKPDKFYRGVCNEIDIVINGTINQKVCTDILLNMLDDEKIKSVLKINGYEIDENFGTAYLTVQDIIGNKYKIICKNYADFLIYQNGTTIGTNVDLIDIENANEIVTNYISVFTPNGERIKMPENSTVLDFAFRIHKDFGLCFKYALINQSTNHIPPYTKLVDGDTVNIVMERNENGSEQNVAQIKWIAYVKTPSAQKSLIKYFEKNYKAK